LYLTLAATGSLSAERVFTPGTGLIGSDGGAGNNYTLSINDSVVATVSGTTFTGVTRHNAGLSGSLTRLVDGTSYIIAGSNITVTSASNGAITIASTAGGGDSYWSSTTAASIFTTGSVAIRGASTGVDAPSDIGSDVFFWVSGSTGDSTTSKSVFGGDVYVSGSLIGSSSLKTQQTITTRATTSGSIVRTYAVGEAVRLAASILLAQSETKTFTIAQGNGACAFDVTFIASESGFSVAKKYSVAAQYGAGAQVFFHKVIDTGPFTGYDIYATFTKSDVTTTLCTFYHTYPGARYVALTLDIGASTAANTVTIF
jgi:hypothetical protein